MKNAIMTKRLTEAQLASGKVKERLSRPAAASMTSTWKEAMKVMKATGLIFEGDLRRTNTMWYVFEAIADWDI